MNLLAILFQQMRWLIEQLVLDLFNEQPLIVIIGGGQGAFNGPEQLAEIMFGVVELLDFGEEVLADVLVETLLVLELVGRLLELLGSAVELAFCLLGLFFGEGEFSFEFLQFSFEFLQFSFEFLQLEYGVG
jgi:hypothetical protein